MKATPTTITSNSDDISTASVSDAGDIMMTSLSQKEEVLNTNNILLNAPVEEWIGGWNVGKKQCTKVEYVAVKMKYFIMSYNSGFCLVDVQASAVYFANSPSWLF
jgi:hypothetical protein